jgi:2-methylisocitrate lyase-like PEP mutase family enzyme
MPVDQATKAERFRALHEGPPFVIPNPWDAGSAKLLAALGFEALATTSGGFAMTLGRLDGLVTLDEKAAHIADLNAATDLPVSADLENGFGDDPEDAARTITRAAEAGAVGGSIEDYGAEAGIYELAQAVERIRAAVEAASSVGFPFMLTARAENHFRAKDPDLDDTIERLQAYADAGADVLYAPGLKSIEQIKAICDAVSKPVNVLGYDKLSLAEIEEAGAQRISIGGGLATTSLAAVAAAAEKIRDEGDFSLVTRGVPVDEWFGGQDREV